MQMTARESQALALLIAAAWLGNYLNIPLFFGVYFLFGSIAVWLITFLYGWPWGTLAAFISSLQTIFWWGHPYAVIIFTLEALLVGYFWPSRRHNLVLLDGLYWLCLGAPLIGVFYGGVMGLVSTQVELLLLKTSVNGILNAFAASLLLSYLPFHRWLGRSQPTPRLTLGQTLFNLLLAAALLPLLLLMILKGQWAFQEMEGQVNASLTAVSTKLTAEVSQIQQERLRGLKKLALLAQKSHLQPSEELQRSAEWLQYTFPSLRQVYLTNANGALVAADPPLKGTGDASQIQPAACSEQVSYSIAPAIAPVGRSGANRLQMKVPILEGKRIQGCVVGEVDLNDFQQRLQSYQYQPQWQIGLLERTGQLIASTPQPQDNLLKAQGFTLRDATRGATEHWLPKDNNIPLLVRWQRSFYRQRRDMGGGLPWMIAIAAPALPYIEALHRQYSADLVVMLAIVLLALPSSHFLSQKLFNVLSRLALVTANLPAQLLQQQEIPWPHSAIAQIDSLVRNFQRMGGALQEKFRELQNLNETLEHRIEERTRELSQSAEQLRRQHQRGQLLADITLKIRQSLELEEILQTTATEVQKLLQADRVVIYQVFPDGTGKAISEAVLPAYPAILGMNFPEETCPQECRTLYAQGRSRAIADIHAPDSGVSDCLVELVDQWEVKAKLIVPILQNPNFPSQTLNWLPAAALGGETETGTQLWGLLIAHQCQTPRQWEPFEIDLCQQIADQIALAISQAQLLEHLEELVAERTAELTQANQQLQQEINDRLQAEQALRHSEEQLRLIANALPVLVSYIDAQQHYRFNNQAYEGWLGQSPAEISGRHLRDVLGETAYEQIREYVEAALSGQRVTFEREMLYKGKDPCWISATYIPHVGERGEVKGFFASISDISERKAMERMKDELISVVSHELRTPLTSIHGSLKLLATGRLGHLSPEGQQMLQIADENTDRLVRLVNDVLDLQRMESGRVTLNMQACDAADLIRRAAEAMQGLAQQNGIALAASPASISVWADPDYILQTLTNLISNAIKFSSPGSTVWLAAQLQELDAGEVAFQVRDRGRGIPSDQLESIFGRFQQVDASDSRSKGGTGLGLAICRQIVERHGGKIWADSVLGEGSTFYFTLPRFRGQEK